MLTIGASEAENFTNNKVTLYSWDGQTFEFDEEEVENQLTVGWYKNPMQILYSWDGKTELFEKDDVAAQLEVGWYEEPVQILYATDGRSQIFYKKEVADQLKVGWYTSPEEARPKKIFTYNVFTKSNLTVAELNKILSNTGLKNCGQYFHKMEQTYNVNALFALSVACHESGNGYHKANSNNYFGIKASSGKFRAFSSQEQCIMYFGELMNKKLYKGKSIDQIGRVYCVPPDHWISCVKQQMKRNWAKL